MTTWSVVFTNTNHRVNNYTLSFTGASLAAGDVVIFALSSGNTETPNPPSGAGFSTLIDDVTETQSGNALTVFAKILDGTEGDMLFGNFQNWPYVLAVLRSSDGDVSSISVSANEVDSAVSGTTFDHAPGTVAADDYLAFIGMHNGDFTDASGFGELASVSGTGYTGLDRITGYQSNYSTGGGVVISGGRADSASPGDVTATYDTSAWLAGATIRLEAVSASGILGTLAATETGSDTFTTTGDVAVDGDLAATETGADASAMTGTVAWPGLTGSMTATESGSDTASASGTVTWPGLTGSLSATEAGADTASFSGVVTDPGIVGSMAVVESGGDTASVSGTVVWPARTGSMAATESGSDTASGSGDVIVSGALAATETGSDTAAFAGIVTDPGIVGSLAAQEVGNDVASASGTVAWSARTGAMAAQESGADVASFSGLVTDPGIVGSMAATEAGSDVASASGTVVWAGRTGSLVAQESGRDAMSATGGVLVSGAMAVTEVGQDVFAGYEAALSRRREREVSAGDPRGLVMLSDSSGSVYRRNGVGGKGSIWQRRAGRTGASRE